MISDETYFITGFPGFITNRLLLRLAKTGGQFFLLVQPALVTRAQQEITRIVRATKAPETNFHIIEGDISQPNLGMTVHDLESVRLRTTRLFHLAAIYDLAVARDLALSVNVTGTRHVNELARSLPRLRHYHHVSTCYVAGKREGRILETELRHEAGFRNFYEESKYLAELEVDSLKGELPITIHRPSVVCGDSRTGETAKYDGVYYLIQYLLRWTSVLSQFNIGNHDVCLNLVPVDFVIESLAVLACDDAAIGKTLQLADPNPITTNQLFNAIATSINGNRSRVTVPPSWVHYFLMLPPSPKITGLPHHGVPYFFVKQTYDSTQAQRLLAVHQIACPPFSSYVDKIVNYAAQHPVL
jgi:thioester reductase-like protein